MGVSRMCQARNTIVVLLLSNALATTSHAQAAAGDEADGAAEAAPVPIGPAAADSEGIDSVAPPGPAAQAPPSESSSDMETSEPDQSRATQAEIAAALAADAEAVESDDESKESPAAVEAAGATSAAAASSMNPDISLILDAALAYFSEDENLQTGGHDPTVNGFNLQQLEMSIGAAVDPYFRFDANLVFSLFGVEVEEAYGTTLALPWRLQSRFGQFLHRFGRINATHPHSWDFVDQPFAVGRVFGGEGGRGLGVELSWLSPLPWYAEVVTTAMQADGEATARSFYGGGNLGVEGPLDLLYVTALKQFFPLGEDWSCLWGLSGAFGPNPTGRSNRSDVYGTDLYVKYRPVTRESQLMIAWQSEVFYRRRQIPEHLLEDVSLYTQLVFQLTKRWATAARYEYGSAAVGLNGEPGLDPLDPDWTEARQRVAANLTFWPTEFSRLRLQGSYDVPDWLERGVWATFLSAELVAGAHGAHNF